MASMLFCTGFSLETPRTATSSRTVYTVLFTPFDSICKFESWDDHDWRQSSVAFEKSRFKRHEKTIRISHCNRTIVESPSLATRAANYTQVFEAERFYDFHCLPWYNTFE